MTQQMGSQSLQFAEAPFILSSASVVGKKEGEGPLGKQFDMVCDSDKFGEDCWEESESTMQKEAAALAMGKASLKPADIRYIFAGDLRGGAVSWCDVCGGRVCRPCACNYFQPFCQCGEAISLSGRVCKPKTLVGDLDSDWQRGVCRWEKRRQSKDYRDYNRRDYGLWNPGFDEYGSCDGTCGIEADCAEF